MKFSNGPISRRTSVSLGVDDALTASPPSRSLICLEIEPLTIQGFFNSLLNIFVLSKEQNVKKLFKSIDAFFDGVHPDIGTYDEFVDSDKVLRFGQGRSRTELLFGIDGTSFDEAKEHCESFTLKDVRIPIMGYEDLIRNKEKAGREQDQADVEQLRKINNQDQNQTSDEE